MTNPLTPQVRVYLYTVTIATLALLVALGYLEAEILPVIVPLVVAVLNVDTTPKGEPEA